MNRVECEKKLKELMREVWDTYKQYSPDGNYLTFWFMDGKMNANNSYWAGDAEKPIALFTTIDEDEN